MTLRNAFESLATEDYQAMEADLFPTRALQYARDVSDRMRVAIDVSTDIGTLARLHGLGASGGYSTWYAQTGSPTSMDPRETQKEISVQTFNQVVAQRWVFS